MANPGAGRADAWWEDGSWNASCSMCGRKRKASMLVRNWQGLYRCPIHNEIRQPQDFARGLPNEDMQVPWAQIEQIAFVTFEPTFPLSISPTVLKLTDVETSLVEEGLGTVPTLVTESGQDLVLEAMTFVGTAQAMFPSWITVESIQWSWANGGVGVTIGSPNALVTGFSCSQSGLGGIAQCAIISSLGVEAIATIQVTS